MLNANANEAVKDHWNYLERHVEYTKRLLEIELLESEYPYKEG